MDPVTDRGLWGFVVIALTLIVLAVGLLYASMPHAEDASDAVRIPPDAEEGYTYTCYCYRDPIAVTIPRPQTRRRHARAGRHRP
ncbi:hypothetical protein [Streptomyces sp. NPDC051569]|uniref:hypothetical protein n=1 Tax=Streptomyces sp. NPDC051569 TaxID=3365661 RepID=UPI0037896F31